VKKLEMPEDVNKKIKNVSKKLKAARELEGTHTHTHPHPHTHTHTHTQTHTHMASMSLGASPGAAQCRMIAQSGTESVRRA